MNDYAHYIASGKIKDITDLKRLIKLHILISAEKELEYYQREMEDGNNCSNKLYALMASSNNALTRRHGRKSEEAACLGCEDATL